jgi:hypothetical protein
MNQLNQIKSQNSIETISDQKLWPRISDIELLNAKKGSLLTLQELMFPPPKEQVNINNFSYPDRINTTGSSLKLT